MIKLGNLFRFFQPKDKVFYKLFDTVSANLIEMSGEFDDWMNSNNPAPQEFLQKMKSFEHKNDDLTHLIFNELNRNFITPFDREDIQALASGLDDIADYIYATTESLVLYKVAYQEAYAQFTSLILQACIELQKALHGLKGFEDRNAIKEACIKVNFLENQADRLFSKSMAELFEGTDAIKIMKISKVLESLEVATDKAEEVAHIIQGVMIKYS